MTGRRHGGGGVRIRLNLTRTRLTRATYYTHIQIYIILF